MIRRKAYAAVLALLVTGIVAAASFNYRGRTAAAPLTPAPATELLGMLPASDAVAFLDARRTLSEVMPNAFINDATTLGRINQEIDKFREQTGTDARSIESIAIGARFREGTARPDFVVGLARGQFNASEAISAGIAKAKAQAEAKKRTFQSKEESYEGTTIYSLERSAGFGMAAVDSNTIVFGDKAGIKALLDVRAGRAARVDSSLVELATLNASAVAGFAANVPPSVLQKMAGGDDFGAAFSTIRQVYGSADATSSTGSVSVTLRSETGEQAQSLAQKLNALKQLASFYFSRTASQQQQEAQTGTLTATPGSRTEVQAAMRALPFPPKWVKDVAITAEGSDVKLRLEEPLTDLASIFAGR